MIIQKTISSLDKGNEAKSFSSALEDFKEKYLKNCEITETGKTVNQSLIIDSSTYGGTSTLHDLYIDGELVGHFSTFESENFWELETRF